MAYPLVQFVAAPAVGAAVLFDFNAGPAAGVLAEGFSEGEPVLEGDPSAPSRRWGYRRIEFTMEIAANRATAHGLIADLARELLRDRSWLLFQASAASKPVWFRTWKTQPGDIDWGEVKGARTNDDTKLSRYYITIALDADPWMRGVRQTLSTVTVNNNPAAGTNPMLYVMPAIVGDAPAPLRIRVQNVSSLNREGTTSMISVIGSDLASSSALVATPSGIGTDTSYVGSAGSTFVGSDYHAVTFANPALVSRIRYTGPSIQHGSYKAMLRVGTTAATVAQTYQFALVNPTDARYLTDPVIETWSDEPSVFKWVDLGVIDWPTSARVDDEFLTSNSSPFSANIRMGRLTASGTAYIDALVLVPVVMDDGDADTLRFSHPTSTESPAASYLDTETESVRLVTSGDVAMQTSTSSALAGGFPHVYPGKKNVVRYFQTIETNTTVAGGDSLAATASLVFSYAPQWLWLADV